MHTSRPRGRRTVTLRRLCSRAPWMTISSFSKRFSVIGGSRPGQPSSGRMDRTGVRIIGCGQDAAHRRRSTFTVCRARARNSSPASACCSRRGRTRPPCCPRLLRALGVVLAVAIVVALLAQSSAPEPVRIALDLLALALRRPHRAALRARGLAVGSLALRADDPARLRGRPARRRAARLGDHAARRDPHRRRRSQLRRAPLRLRDAHARRRAARARRAASSATPSASPRRSSTRTRRGGPHLDADRGAGCL